MEEIVEAFLESLIDNSYILMMRYLFLLTVLTLSSCGLISTGNNDKFWPYELTIEANKADYSVGDNVVLVASVIPKKADSIRLYEDITKSFSLSVRARTENDIDFSDNDFTGTRGTPASEDKINVIEISPTDPYQLIIEGRILKSDADGIVFDFEEFGTFEKTNVGDFSVWGF